MEGCPICEKHEGKGMLVGEVLFEDERVLVSHAPPGVVGGYLGYFFVDAKRHARGLADLEDDEACALARVVTRLAKALERDGAEHVYAFTFNHIPHHHVHVVARHPGTPREFWGPRVDEWDDAPRGDATKVAALCDRLRTAF